MLLRQCRAGSAEEIRADWAACGRGLGNFSREVTDLAHVTCRELHTRGSLVVVVRGMKELR